MLACIRIRAISVFESVVYHCWPIDRSNPCRPTLEVEALLRHGDADEGPLLLPVPDYVAMVGTDQARDCLRVFERQGRIVQHQDVSHIAFPAWTRPTD